MTFAVRAQQGDTVDQLCQRHLGTTAGVTEVTYTLNPGIAALGPVLPLGLLVTLPEPNLTPRMLRLLSASPMTATTQSGTSIPALTDTTQ